MAQSENGAINLAEEGKSSFDSGQTRDDYRRAAQKYKEALKIAESVQSDKWPGICSNQLGVIQSGWGRIKRSRIFRQDLRILPIPGSSLCSHSPKGGLFRFAESDHMLWT